MVLMVNSIYHKFLTMTLTKFNSMDPCLQAEVFGYLDHGCIHAFARAIQPYDLQPALSKLNVLYISDVVAMGDENYDGSFTAVR